MNTHNFRCGEAVDHWRHKGHVSTSETHGVRVAQHIRVQSCTFTVKLLNSHWRLKRVVCTISIAILPKARSRYFPWVLVSIWAHDRPWERWLTSHPVSQFLAANYTINDYVTYYNVIIISITLAPLSSSSSSSSSSSCLRTQQRKPRNSEWHNQRLYYAPIAAMSYGYVMMTLQVPYLMSHQKLPPASLPGSPGTLPLVSFSQIFD